MSSVSNSHESSHYQNVFTLGLGRGAVGFLLEHPLDSLKTRLQADLNAKKLPLAKQIFQDYGIRGFYTGGIPNAVRIVGKQTARTYMVLGIPDFYKRVLPTPTQHSFPYDTVLTGLTIASIESCIISPFEKLKVDLMTMPLSQENKLTTFFRQHRGHLISALLPGFKATYVKSMASWVSFLTIDEQVKNYERERTGTNVLNFPSLMKVSLVVGICNTALIMPIDYVKTKAQRHHFPKAEGPQESNPKILQTMYAVYKTHGLSGVYRGWQIRMGQYMLHSIYMYAIDKFSKR